MSIIGFDSHATPQPLPRTSPYGISVLDLFQTYTRITAKAAGIPDSAMPPYDSGRPVKNWLDTQWTPETVYWSLAVANVGSTAQIIQPPYLVPFILPQNVAETLNLPDDAPAYPVYIPQASTYYLNDGGNHLASNIEYLSEMDQAKGLAAAIGVPNAEIISYQPAAGPSSYEYVYPDLATDPRQYFVFAGPFGELEVAGILLAQLNSAGIGHPGFWIISNGVVRWQASHVLPPVVPNAPLVPIPMRQLYDGSQGLGRESWLIQVIGQPMISNSALPLY